MEIFRGETVQRIARREHTLERERVLQGHAHALAVDRIEVRDGVAGGDQSFDARLLTIEMPHHAVEHSELRDVGEALAQAFVALVAECVGERVEETGHLHRARAARRLLVAGQGMGFDVAVRHTHRVVPNLRRQRAARGAPHRREVVMADPHAGDEVRRVADEPSVTPIGAGAGFAGHIAPIQARARAGAAEHHSAHHGIHAVDDILLHHHRAFIWRAAIKLFAGGIGHREHDVGIEAVAVRHERAECRCHFPQCRFDRAE